MTLDFSVKLVPFQPTESYGAVCFGYTCEGNTRYEVARQTLFAASIGIKG